MTSRHDRTLEQLLQHPMVMNIKWRDVVHMFEAMGATTEVVHGGRQKVSLNGQEHSFHIPHGKTLNSRDELMEIRHFLERAGMTSPGE